MALCGFNKYSDQNNSFIKNSPYFRLSERNCVEIVQLLQQQKLIDLIYTTDGKEFLTSQELGKEIREELQVQGGRLGQLVSPWRGVGDGGM